MGGLVVNRATRSDVTWAFLIFHVGIVFGRAVWLGDPWAIPIHQVSHGALLIFAFFMISDPKTTPDSRTGRILYAFLIASGGAFVQFALFRPNGLLYSLVFFALTTPLIDRLFPGRPYEWAVQPGHGTAVFPALSPALAAVVPIAPLPPVTTRQPDNVTTRKGAPLMKRNLILLLTGILLFGLAPDVSAFCGFYVAKADTKLFNRASQVVLVRDGDRTVLTMANDFQGDPREFAIVIPVPTVLEKGQIHVGQKAIIDHLDAYTSPRLVEYFDGNPCQLRRYLEKSMPMATADAAGRMEQERARSLGVTIEASYTVGEYDILILSAKESSGLETWLRESGYRVPNGASRVLRSYLRQGMKFFVAKVNLEEQSKLGYTYLRPLQMAFESPKFMLPIRLGTLNAKGHQELFVYTLTKNGRVETTNYRTVKLPTGSDLPVFVKNEFGEFYKAMFSTQVERHDMRVVFLEYAWDMAWCDPCAADPLSRDELSEIGVFWLDDRSGRGPAQNVFVTRLHVRYDAEHFPEDLIFQETSDRSNFQGRYVLRHPWKGPDNCPATREYFAGLRDRQEREARTLASLTGWDINDIRRKMDMPTIEPGKDPWWKRLWGNLRTGLIEMWSVVAN